jgi:multidrug efflux pump subunit AcrA (membrane-fusion protein)
VTQQPAEQKGEPIIARLARISRSDAPPDEFLKHFFILVRAAVGAEIGGLWVYNSETRQLAPKATLAAASGPLATASEEFLTKVIYRAVEEQKPVLYYPDETSDVELMKRSSVICAPLAVDDKVTVVVLLAKQADGATAYNADNVHMVLSLGAYLPAYFTNVQLRLSSANSARLAKLVEVEGDLAGAIDQVKMAFILANRSREIVFADRVFVASARGTSYRVEAVSGVDDVQEKSAVARNLAEVVREFAKLDGDWHFTPAYIEKVEDAGLREKLTVYFETSEYRSLLLNRIEDEKSLLSVIGYERRQEGTYTAQDMQILRALAKMSAQPLRRAREYRELPGITAVEGLQRLRARALGPQRNRFFIKIALAAAAAAILLFGRIELVVHGDCRIIPYMTSYAAARTSGIVKQILKNERDTVKKDDVVAVLDQREVDNSIRETEAEIQKKEASISYYMSTNNGPEWSRETKELAVFRIRLDGLLLQKEFTKVVSPQDGVIVTPRDRINTSLDAAVRRGEAICEVADPSRVYVEVEIKERDIALVKPGQTLEFALAGAAGRRFTTTVASVSPVSRQSYGKNVFIARGLLDNADGAFLMGSTGAADLPAGSRSIVYVIFRSTIDWVYSKFI